MATKVHMEALSPTMEEGQVVKWLKEEGDAVSSGEILAEIETDKATMELVARGDGVLRKILLGEGGTAPVGDVIAVIAAEDEDISALVGADGGGASEAAAAAAAPAPAPTAAAAPVAAAGPGGAVEASPATAPAAGGPTAPADTTAPAVATGAAGAEPAGEGRVKASPLARRLAEEAGLSLRAVEGSGPGGRIVKRDIEAALEAAAAAPAPAAAPAGVAGPVFGAPPALPAAEGPDYEDVPLSQIRKTIARRLAESIGPVPHFFLTIHVDMGRTLEARKRVNEMLAPQGDKISVNDFIIRATAAALRQHPSVNSAWMGDRVRRHRRVHVGVAVAIEEGLITPVIRDTDRKGIVQISREVREMADRARQKRLTPEEYTGATFSVSNLGMFGIEEFTAVINPPEAGIIAVGAVEDRPVAEDGTVVIRQQMRITMSCDHRVIDGATGSRFLATLKSMLEEPAAMLL